MNELVVRLNARIANQREQINHLSFVVRELRTQLALAGEAATAAKTPKSGLVHEHATAKPERPSPTPILPKKERTKQ